MNLIFFSVLCHIEIEGHILNTSTNSYIKMANHVQFSVDRVFSFPAVQVERVFCFPLDQLFC
jgi:hypothetical protein